MATESASADEDDRFRTLAEALDQMICVTETSGRMLWANGALFRETGFRVEDFWFDSTQNPFIHPDDVAGVVAVLADLAASERRHSEPIRNRFFDRWGSIRQYRSTVHKVRFDGRDAFLFVIDHDTEKPAPVDEESYRHLVETAHEGIVKLSIDGKVHFANMRFQELVGRDAVALSHDSLLSVVAPVHREAACAALRSIHPGAPTVTFETELLHASGEPLWVNVSASRLSRGQDNGLIVAIVRDVSEARRIEQGLREAQRLESLGVLAGGVAHDFNNLLTAILGNVELASKLVPADGDRRIGEALSDLRHAAGRARGLTSSLLAYVGQTSSERETVDLAGAVLESARLLRSIVPKTVTLDIDASREPVYVEADPTQLSQILMNLVTNAAEARPFGALGNVRVTVEPLTVGDEGSEAANGRRVAWVPRRSPPGRYAALRVRDDGEGMSPERQRKIFDPFFTTKAAGRGLGLSVLLGIVRTHSGAISIDSVPSRGTTITVLLPISAAPALAAASGEAPASAARDEARLGGGGFVLLVDDEPSLRKLGKMILESVGFDVVLAADGAQALAIFDEDPTRYRAVVIDHTMPGMRGDVLLERLRDRRPELPAVRTSGYVDALSAAAPRCVFLPKPYSGEELQRAVLDAIASSSGAASTR